jgi:YfiH family protein
MLLTVSAADCVPVFLVAENSRIVAVAHAGWRGVAGGMVENALAAMLAHDARLEEVRVHCGPSICGRCYEVGPEVHQAIHLSGGPFVKAPIDLRAAIAIRFVDAGVRPERITLSSHCTYCGGDFFSHRRGSEGRQVGVLGVRE